MLRATAQKALSGLVGVLVALAVITVPAAPASAVDNGYYQLSYTDDIYHVEYNYVRPITFAEWSSAGYPIPQAAPTEFVKYPWSGTIYAFTPWQQDLETWQVDALTFGQWQRAGYPAPQSVGWVHGSSVYKWGTAGELFLQAPDGTHHKLSYAQWQATGFRPFADRQNEGWVKLSWSDSIARMTDRAAGQGYPVGYAEWRQHDFPTPQVARRFAGDQFNQYYGDASIYYSGPTMHGAITYSQWAGAGFPTPDRPLPADPKDCADFQRQRDAQDWFAFYYQQHGDWANLDGDDDGIACETLPR